MGTDEELEAKRLALLEGAKKSYLRHNPKKTDAGLMEIGLQLAEDTEGIIEGRRWHLLESTTSRVFVTSDNPVVFTRPGNGALWGALELSPGSVLLPLSPTRCVLIDDAKRGDALLRISREKADAINNYVIAYAHHAVFANLYSKTIAAAFDLTEFSKNTDVPQ
ncbi:MAG: DUF4238 domain-containing protein [Pyrinomonadaceae bacterium]